MVPSKAAYLFAATAAAAAESPPFGGQETAGCRPLSAAKADEAFVGAGQNLGSELEGLGFRTEGLGFGV